MMHKILKTKWYGFLCILACVSFSNAGVLNQYLKLSAEGKNSVAKKTLDNWSPKSFEEESYKKYFTAINQNKIQPYWDLYEHLVKNKKMIKLQHESIKKILQLDTESKAEMTLGLKNFNSVAKEMLKNLQGQPEGAEYELIYLKWILKRKNINELCKTERKKWLSQASLSLKEVTEGLQTCPITYDDFIYRLRLLIFSGEELKAKEEIDAYVIDRKLAAWEKAYLQAVYYSNVGDPTSAFAEIKNYENDLRKTKNYYDNFFYIAQRAGELKKAEEAVNHIIADVKLKPKEKKDFTFQKGFLFYQTKRYKEAIAIFNELIKAHPAAKRKRSFKNKEYDDLTWLRAWCYYLSQNYKVARDLFEENKDWSKDKARNLYWLAQAEWALDNQIKSVSYFKQLADPVIRGESFSYYNYLAWIRYESYKGFAGSIDKKLLASETIKNPIDDIKNKLPADDIAATDEGNIQIINQDENVLNNSVGIVAESSKQLKNELSWADDLIRWGYRDLAKWHLFEIEKTLKSRQQSDILTQYYFNNQYYNRSLSLMSRMSSTSGKKLDLKEDMLLWRALFPKAYESATLKEAKSRGISHYLVWSIMKAETQYKADAISPVGAVGLMQFMPYTSQKVSVLLGEQHKIEDLFEPEMAVKYGAMYLRKLSDELGGHLPLIAAAYNGGPHRVKLWLRNLKQKDGTQMEFDAFIEHIPFNETRTYVKRVLNFYYTYQKVYDRKFDYASSKWLTEKINYKLIEPVVLKEEWPKVIR